MPVGVDRRLLVDAAVGHVVDARQPASPATGCPAAASARRSPCRRCRRAPPPAAPATCRRRAACPAAPGRRTTAPRCPRSPAARRARRRWPRRAAARRGSRRRGPCRCRRCRPARRPARSSLPVAGVVVGVEAPTPRSARSGRPGCSSRPASTTRCSSSARRRSRKMSAPFLRAGAVRVGVDALGRAPARRSSESCPVGRPAQARRAVVVVDPVGPEARAVGQPAGARGAGERLAGTARRRPPGAAAPAPRAAPRPVRRPAGRPGPRHQRPRRRHPPRRGPGPLPSPRRRQ